MSTLPQNDDPTIFFREWVVETSNKIGALCLLISAPRSPRSGCTSNCWASCQTFCSRASTMASILLRAGWAGICSVNSPDFRWKRWKPLRLKQLQVAATDHSCVAWLCLPWENEDEPVDVQRMGFSIYSHPRDTEEFCPDVEPDDTIYHHI